MSDQPASPGNANRLGRLHGRDRQGRAKVLEGQVFFRFLLLALFAGVRGNKLIHDKHQLLRVHPVTHSLIEGVVAHVDFDLQITWVRVFKH